MGELAFENSPQIGSHVKERKKSRKCEIKTKIEKRKKKKKNILEIWRIDSFP